MNDKMRADFEAWAGDNFLLCERVPFMRSPYKDDEYDDCDVQTAWEVWQGSRAALVVELPEEYDDEWLNTDEVRQAIEAAGVRVKP